MLSTRIRWRIDATGHLIAIFLLLTLSAVSSVTASHGAPPTYHIATTALPQQRLLIEHTYVTVGSEVDSLGIRFWLPEPEEGVTLTWDSVLVNGTKGTYHVDSTVIRVNYPARPDSSTEARIDFFYRIAFKNDEAMSGLYLPQSLAYGEYYPRSVRADTATTRSSAGYTGFSCSIRVPQGFTLLAAVEPTDTIADSEMVEFVLPEFRTQYLVWATLPREFCTDTTLAGLKVTIAQQPAHRITAATLTVIDSVLQLYESLFGKLSFSRLNVLYTLPPPDIGGGNVGNFLILDNGASHNLLVMAEGQGTKEAICHELAHLWWGSSVMTDDWLGEGLATYWGSRVARSLHENPSTGNMRDGFIAQQYRWSHRISGSFAAEQNEAHFGYFKGERIVAMLGLETGADTLAAILKQFYQERKETRAGIKEFRQAAVEIGGDKVNHFFETWTDSCFHQNYRMAKVSSQKRDSCYQNSVKIEHEGRAWSSVPIVVRYADKSEDTLLLPAGELQYSGQSRTKIKSVEIDPERQILEDKRSDNAWPVRLRVYPLSINPIRLFTNLGSFASTEESRYQVLVTPDFPSHNYRFGWYFGLAVLGKRESWFSDLRGRHILRLRGGYGPTLSEWRYAATYGNQLVLRDHWGAYYEVTADRGAGRQNQHLSIILNRWIDVVGQNSWQGSVSVGRGQYYQPEGLRRYYWPDGHATVLSFDLKHSGTVKLLHKTLHVDANSRWEVGFPVSDGDKKYQRLTAGFQTGLSVLSGGVSYSMTKTAPLQERFDLSCEGRMKSIEPLTYYSRRILTVWSECEWLRHLKLHPRLFASYAHTPEWGSLWESGIGLSLQPMLSFTASLKLVLDIPLLASTPSTREFRFGINRIQLKLCLFGSENESNPEFRIKVH